jgi:hypothetical protein
MLLKPVDSPGIGANRSCSPVFQGEDSRREYEKVLDKDFFNILSYLVF